ncbi:hypothetical protein [Limibacterium fermenti]|uniref:hypothetical protein n=1 Tax=Limibacterium fermenti TaxID=3229863 RepID=UPI003A5E914D
MEITVDFLKKVLQNNYPNYKKTVDLANDLKVHYNGRMPDDLISKRRPNEPEEVKNYRKEIYVPITKNPISKVLTSLQKIRRSKDWVINYGNDMPAIVRTGESLKDYCEYHYPGFTSVTNWVFSELLGQYLLDANAFVAVVLKKKQTNENEYEEPVAEIFPSENTVYYEEGAVLVVKSRDVIPYMTPGGRYTYYDGRIYYALTPERIVRFEQVRKNGQFEIAIDYEHGVGELPACKTGGVFRERVNNDTIYESRIAGMVPHLKEAAREYSDLQAEVVQHIHSEKYYYTATDCKACNGSGRLSNDKICDKCNGTGLVQSISPYGQYLIKQKELGTAPQPPIGYIQKDTSIAKLQDERVDKHIYRALASINMQFLDQTPLNQSGYAKEVDKDELNNFVNSIAEDLVKIMDNVYRYICDYRYMISVPDKETRRSMLPVISVPEKFDLLGSDYMISELKSAKEAGINPIIIKNMEIEFLKKQYNANPDIASELECIYEIDPLPGLSEDDKLVMLNNGGISEEDYAVSCNITQLVRRAKNENSGFFKKEAKEKRDLIYGYVKNLMEKTDGSNTKRILGAGMKDEG